MNNSKYCGVIPAFYACYDKNGDINKEMVETFTEYLIGKGIKGLYVGGSSGECIYQNVSERKTVLEHVMKVAKGKITIIAHVASSNTKDSMELARHAESLGVDAISAIPPIYYKVGDEGIRAYWNAISSAAPNTDFIVYNIPQLTGIAISPACLKEMAKNPKVIGIKNTSMSVIDIIDFKAVGEEGFAVLNGPDEQLVHGLLAGACGGIGGTYGACPELYCAIYNATVNGEIDKALKLQKVALELIGMLTSGPSNMYATIKAVIKLRTGINLGGVREPLVNVTKSEDARIKAIAEFIDQIEKSL